MDKLEREIRAIIDFNKIAKNGSNHEDEFTSKQNQNKRLSFRVTPESHRLLKEMANRRNCSIASLSKDIMALGLKKNFRNQYKLAVTNDAFQDIASLVRQTQSLGNNVNQIAKSNHSFNKHISLLDLSENTVVEHDRMNKDIYRLSQSVEKLSRGVDMLCQQLAK